MKTVIVEDEIAGQELLKLNISESFPECQILAIASTVKEAIEQIELHKPALVFLDIQIKGGTGFDVLKHFKDRSFEVIFITAHDNFVIQALRAEALDFILKPFSKTDFKEAVLRAKKIISNRKRDMETFKNALSVYTPSGKEFINFNDIVFLEADGSYTKINLIDTNILSTKNLGEYELLLPPYFYRCHHSFMINLNQIKKFEKGRSGLLEMNCGYKVPVSQRKMKEFSELLDKSN
jgi:two-component system LytT family response regulator